MNPRVRLGLLLFALVLAADQASKQWIIHGLDLPDRGPLAVLPVLQFTFVWNRGITFGLLNGGSTGLIGPLVLGAVALAIVAGLLLWLRKAENWPVAAALGAIAGGAMGNVIDRVRYGAVVDFIHLHVAGWDPFRYVFNLGDSAIVAGVAVLLIDGMVTSQKGGTSGREAR